MSEQVEHCVKLVLKAFDKRHNPDNDTSEGQALHLLSQLPNLATAKDEDEDKFTLLHYACYNGWYEVTKILTKRYNCDPNCKNAAGPIPVSYTHLTLPTILRV